MNKKGFITSALLYGILSLFLILILGTVSILGNRKLANDKIKESALDDVQHLTTNETCFVTTTNSRNHLTITDYDNSCDKTVFIPENLNGKTVDEIGDAAFSNKNLINVTIKSNITEIAENAFSSNDNIVFYIKAPSDHIVGSPWGATNATVHWDY